MNTENIPQVGSVWEINGYHVAVSNVAKRGRGWQVRVGDHNGNLSTYRLRDFLKAAKPL